MVGSRGKLVLRLVSKYLVAQSWAGRKGVKVQKGYKARFFDDFYKNLRALEGQITVDEKEHITNSLKNTCLFAKALHNTFNDAGDVAGMMLMVTACDYSPIEEG